MWAERADECRRKHLLRSPTSDSVHGTSAVGQPRYHHTSPSFLCAVSIRLGLASKLTFSMHNFMLLSLSESDPSKGERTLHNNHFLSVLFEHMK